MKNINTIKFNRGSKEEVMPDFALDFPYISSYVDLDRYEGGLVPWHWHKEMELFYIQSGVLEYYTPNGKWTFPAGSGGIVNSNILHMTRPQIKYEGTIQLIHIFDTSFIAGNEGSRIEKKYIAPIISASQIEIIEFLPDNSEHTPVLNMLQESFRLSENEFGYEIKLHSVLSEIWLQIFNITKTRRELKRSYIKKSDKIKLMMIYIHEHYSEKIAIAEVAAAAFISERECYRVFHDSLRMTPVEYIKNYRLQKACYQLIRSQEDITAISQSCGLGSSSYFGKVFREHIGCTPIEYRRKWQDSDR